MSFINRPFDQGKTIENTYDFRQRPIEIIKDPHSMVKTASSSNETTEYIKKHLKPEKGRTKLLALFLGAGEYYGSNRNGDWFGEDDLIKTYHTFKEHGHVYKHHQNKDPNKKFGDIEFVTFNPVMKRVEGIMSLIDNLCEEELTKIEQGKDIPVSMAAKLKYDVCSICERKAKKISDYCPHLRDDMKKIYDDGREVHAKNPDPIFFDISIVWKPADETAFVLEKVANAGGIARATYDGHSFSYDPYWIRSIEKKSAIKKLADIEKNLDSVFAGKVKDDGTVDAIKNTVHRASEQEEVSDSTVKDMKEKPIEELLPSLTNSGIMLTLREFLKVIGKEDLFEQIKEMMPGSFSRLMDKDLSDDSSSFMLGHGDTKKDFTNCKKIVRSFSPSRKAQRLSISIVCSSKPKTKLIAKKASEDYKYVKKSSEKAIAQKIGDLYNLYKIGFFTKNPSADTALLVVSNNLFA